MRAVPAIIALAIGLAAAPATAQAPIPEGIEIGLSTDRAHSLRCGFSEHLVKPLRLQDLERLVG